MVAQGIGIALLPEWARNVKNDRMVFRSLGSSAPMIQTAVAWRRDDTSKAVNNFLEIVREIMPPSRSHVAE
jgi:DNA-binding transcriptional LysR family regulator